MKTSSSLMLVAAVAVTIVLVLGGLATILFGVGLAMFGGGGSFIALVGLLLFGCGVVFAFKVVRPAWRLAKED